MSNDRRAPWWYSGEDDQPEPIPMIESADEPAPDATPADPAQADATYEVDEEAQPASPAMDWTALVAGAVKMVDWATERVMAPHAEHGDPAEHPDCMVCRTVTLIGDPVGLMGGGQRPAADDEGAGKGVEVPPMDIASATGVQPIWWIPIVESRD